MNTSELNRLFNKMESLLDGKYDDKEERKKIIMEMVTDFNFISKYEAYVTTYWSKLEKSLESVNLSEESLRHKEFLSMLMEEKSEMDNENYIKIDENIKDLYYLLTENGYITANSCSGHEKDVYQNIYIHFYTKKEISEMEYILKKINEKYGYEFKIESDLNDYYDIDYEAKDYCIRYVFVKENFKNEKQIKEINQNVYKEFKSVFEKGKIEKAVS